MYHLRCYAVAILAILPFICSAGDPGRHDLRHRALRSELSEYVGRKCARIGIGVVTQDGDTISVNGYDPFPMLSVYKFPQAIAVAEFCRTSGLSLNDTVPIGKSELLPDTYSPLRDKYGIRDLALSVSDLLSYTLQLSDNNACDILFRLIGGPSVADSIIRDMGFRDIRLLNTEAEMHRDTDLCYRNSATPVGMIRLLSVFDREMRESLPDIII